MKATLLCGASAFAIFVAPVANTAVAAEAAASTTATTTAVTAPTTIGELVVVAEKRSGKLPDRRSQSPSLSQPVSCWALHRFRISRTSRPALPTPPTTTAPTYEASGGKPTTWPWSPVSLTTSTVSTTAQTPRRFCRTRCSPIGSRCCGDPRHPLYGRNADGGSINYVSKRPTKEWQGEIHAGADSYAKWYGEALFSGPLTDSLRMLIGGNYTQQNFGYYNNINGPREGGSVAQGGNGQSLHLEVQFEGNVGDRFDYWLKVATNDYNTSFHTQTLLGPQDTREFYDALFPNQNYGLCALPGGASGIGCKAPFSAFPAGNYGGTIDPVVSATALQPAGIRQ